MPAVERPDAPFSTSSELNAIFRAVTGAGHVALAVSGGSDSMALMQLAHLWAKQAATPARLTVLTVDHGLRSGSLEEAQKVASWARQLGLPHSLLNWAGPRPHSGLQEKARAARYALMTAWCKANGADVLMTAHTAEDQAETLVMRLARGTGVEGLGGIPAVRVIEGVACHRPLLGLSRQALRDFLGRVGQEWIDDPSNENIQFERIRVRKLRPRLEEAGLTAQALSQTALRAGRADRALQAATGDFLAAHVQRFEQGYAAIDLAAFSSLPEEIRIRALDRLIQTYGAGERAELAALERLVGWFGADSPGARATLGGAEIACRERLFVVGREPGRIGSAPVPLENPLVWDGRWHITATVPMDNLNVRPVAEVRGIARIKTLPAFVQAGLPAICSGDEPVFLPFWSPAHGNSGFSARFCR